MHAVRSRQDRVTVGDSASPPPGSMVMLYLSLSRSNNKFLPLNGLPDQSIEWT